MASDANTLTHVITRLGETDEGDRCVTHIDGDDERRQISYRALLMRASHVLYHLQEKGMRPGGHLIICTPSNEQFIDAFWACQLGGITAVPVAPGQTHQHRRKFFNVFRQLEGAFVFSNRATFEPMHAFAAEHGLQAESELLRARSVHANELSAELERGEIHTPAADDVALIQFSSGSTGNPKGVLLSHENLLTNVRALESRAHITAADSWFCWAPLYHDMGLIACHLQPLVSGIDQYFMPTERFARRPLAWLTQVAATRATLLASPNFGLRHVLQAMRGARARDRLEDLDLSHVRILFNAAEPVSAEVCEAFQTALAPYGLPGDVIHPTYGLAEACVAVSCNAEVGPLHTRVADRTALNVGDALTESGAAPLRLVGLGEAVPDCEIRVVDDAGTPSAAGVVGHVEIRGRNVTRGYYGQAEQELRTAEQWLDTGDLGAIDDQLYIVGRAKDTIILNGVTYHAHDLEGLCAEADGVGPERCLCTSAVRPDDGAEAAVVFVVHRGDLEDFVPIVTRVKRALSEGAFVDPYRVVPVRTLPRTTSGKLQRYALAEAFSNGEFDAALDALDGLLRADSEGARSDARSEVERTLLDICRTYITTEEVHLDDNLLDKGTSSLALVEIAEAVEECYPGMLDLSDFLEHTSIASLAAFLEARLA